MTDKPELTREQVEAWLRERLDNCHRIASVKTGNDRDGWLEDAAYFGAALRALSGGVGELLRKHADAILGWNRRVEHVQQEATKLQRDLNAARACIRDADALTRKFIDKVESGGAFSKTTYAECVKFQADHKSALAHLEPAGGEKV